jgi:ankyrin repeat protein
MEDVEEIEVDDSLWIAASEGSLDRVLHFLQQLNAKSVDFHDENGFTALMAAVQYGHVKLADELISRGADVNFRDTDGATALHHCDTVECAKLLINKGADMKIKNRDGETPLMLKKSDLSELDDEFDDDEDKSNLTKLVATLEEMQRIAANLEGKKMKT